MRLVQGDFSRRLDFSTRFDLAGLASEFGKFASGIHVVDLDGAKSGKLENELAIAKIVQSATVPVEVGGGLRDLQSVERILNLGVSRAILGTRALEDFSFLEQCLKKFSRDHVAVGVDLKGDFVATHGWAKVSGVRAVDFLKKLENAGVENVLCTQIENDGMLGGLNFQFFTQLCQQFSKLKITASGGVGSVEDLEKIGRTGVSGVIFGRAFFEGRITTKQIVDFLES